MKWSAPEAFERGRFSTQSDIWSFGVVLWEIFTYGKHPYPELSNKEVIEKIPGGYRMTPPAICPEDIKLLMMQCWEYDPHARPTFQVNPKFFFF